MPWFLFADNAAPQPELNKVAALLQPLIEKQNPKPEISFPVEDPSTLLVQYKSQPYQIHSVSMNGEVSTNLYKTIGPGFKGFVLRVILQDKETINQAATPCYLREPYWNTYMDVTPLDGTQKQIYWSLSYGGRTDTNLVAQMIQTLRQLKNEKSKSPANKNPNP